ncbi:hypothetical protein ACL02R_03620 [Streptomyces sp. MS19]|uniref:hypothetical protein n=1 Tax=Streptomyces sp. MS19 TaxID=3385972 RepID=UPI0039A11CD7
MPEHIPHPAPPLLLPGNKQFTIRFPNQATKSNTFALAATDINGWIWDYNLNNGGSTKLC